MKSVRGKYAGYKITLAKQDKVKSLLPYVKEILCRIGVSGALVTDETCLSDFATAGKYRDGKYTLPEMIGFSNATGHEYLWELAERVKFCEETHKLCRENEEAIGKSKKCTCCYCQRTYGAKTVKRYTASDTAICPKCGVTIVIPDIHGVKFTRQKLKDMYEYWFRPVTPEEMKEYRKKRKQKHETQR